MLSYRPARLHRLSGGYDNPMPESDISPQSGTMNLATMVLWPVSGMSKEYPLPNGRKRAMRRLLSSEKRVPNYLVRLCVGIGRRLEGGKALQLYECATVELGICVYTWQACREPATLKMCKKTCAVCLPFSLSIRLCRWTELNWTGIHMNRQVLTVYEGKEC